MSLSQLINRVAADTGRPVVLEDRRQQIVAYSPHDDTYDRVRQSTILKHRADPEISQWLHELGVYRGQGVTRVPANDRLGMLARVCVPVLAEHFALGHLWFIEAPDAMPQGAVERAAQLAARIGEEWARLEAETGGSRAREEEAVRSLLTDPATGILDAAEFLADRLSVPITAPARVYLLAPSVAASASALERTARLAAASFPAAVGAVHRGQALVIEAPQRVGAMPCDESAARLRAIGDAELGAGATLGVGSLVDALAEARASYADARRAIEIRDGFGLDCAAAHFDRLGAYRGIFEAAQHGMAATDFHPGIARLHDERDGDVLWATLQTYLRTGGRAQEAAGELAVHRSSLYHRLSRIESILDVDLQDGVQRLSLHMAVMLAALEHAAPSRP